jgi:hypothetical protein
MIERASSHPGEEVATRTHARQVQQRNYQRASIRRTTSRQADLRVNEWISEGSGRAAELDHHPRELRGRRARFRSSSRGHRGGGKTDAGPAHSQQAPPAARRPRATASASPASPLRRRVRDLLYEPGGRDRPAPRRCSSGRPRQALSTRWRRCSPTATRWLPRPLLPSHVYATNRRARAPQPRAAARPTSYARRLVPTSTTPQLRQRTCLTARAARGALDG